MDLTPQTARSALDTWLLTRAPLDFSLLARIFTTTALLLGVLRGAPAHAKLVPMAGGGQDVRPLQEQSDNVWHSLLWKWLLVPRGLTILPHAVVFGMHKAFDFDLAGLGRSFAGRRTLAALASGPLCVHLVRKRNGEMARVFYSAPDGAWLFGQKNRSILVADAAALQAVAAAQASLERPPTAHAVEVGQVWFRMLAALPPGGAAAVQDYCAAHVLALEKVGSALQQHLARETAEGAPAELAVFGICRLADVAPAVLAGCLPRLPVAAMVADCARLGLPWAGGLDPARLLAAAAEAAGAGSAPPLPAPLAAALAAAAAQGGECPPVAVTSAAELEHLRRAVLALDDDNLEGCMPVLETPTGAVVALFKFKCAIYYVRRRLREQLRTRITPPQLPALRARLEEWVQQVPPSRAPHYRALAQRLHHFALCTRLEGKELDRRILGLLEMAGAPGDAATGCYLGCGVCDPAAAVQATALCVLPGGMGEAVEAALAAAHPALQVHAWPAGQPCKDGALKAWAREAHGVVLLDASRLPQPEELLKAELGLQRLVLVLPKGMREGGGGRGSGSSAFSAQALAAVHPTNPRAAQAMLSKAVAVMEGLAARAAQGGCAVTVVEDAHAAAGAAVVYGPRTRPPPTAVLGAGGAGEPAPMPASTLSAPDATLAAQQRPSATRLAVFIVGVVGLGKTTLAHALVDWFAAAAAAAAAAADATPATPLTAQELDQDRFAGLGGTGEEGRAAQRAALLTALHTILDAGTPLVLIHRNGPGSRGLLEALRCRGVPWVCVYPQELLGDAPRAHAVLACAASLLQRRDSEAGAPQGMGALAAAQKMKVLRFFYAALPEAAASIAPLDSARALPLAYFAPQPAPLSQGAAEAVLWWCLGAAAAGLKAGESEAEAWDAALAEAAGSADAVGALGARRAVKELCEELGPRLRELAGLEEGERCSLVGEGGAGEREDAYVGVFLARTPASAPLFAAHAERDLHVTLAHCVTAPGAVAAAAGAGWLGARVAVGTSHRICAEWACAGGKARVEALVVTQLRMLPGEGPGCSSEMDLLPMVRSGAPHVTLRAEGASSVAAGAVLRLLQAHCSSAGLPVESAVVQVQGVRFSVQPEAGDFLGVVAMCGAEG